MSFFVFTSLIPMLGIKEAYVATYQLSLLFGRSLKNKNRSEYKKEDKKRRRKSIKEEDSLCKPEEVLEALFRAELAEVRHDEGVAVGGGAEGHPTPRSSAPRHHGAPHHGGRAKVGVLSERGGVSVGGSHHCRVDLREKRRCENVH